MTLGQTLRDDGIKRAEDHPHDDWKQSARDGLELLAATGKEFTSEDIRALIPVDITTHEPRALGGIVRKFLADGCIVSVGFRESSNPQAHCRPVRVFRGVL